LRIVDRGEIRRQRLSHRRRNLLRGGADNGGRVFQRGANFSRHGGLAARESLRSELLDLFRESSDLRRQSLLLRAEAIRALLDSDEQSLICGWEERARRVVAEFRADCSSHVDDPSVRMLIDELCRQSPEFAQFLD